MENLEKLHLLDKLLRELDDLKNSETSLIKKVGQIEAENINLSDKLIDSRLPEVYKLIDQALTETTALHAEFEEARDEFSKKHKLDEIVEAN